MKKIPTTLLVLLTGLIFNTTAFALFDADMHRCKIEYTQLDVLTGVEKTYKYTTQFDVRFPVRQVAVPAQEAIPADAFNDARPATEAIPESITPDDFCARGTTKLIPKVAKQVRKKSTNIVVGLNIEVMCKQRDGGWFSSSWNKYKSCVTPEQNPRIGYAQELTDYMVSHYPKQVASRMKDYK
jgi:hypothetical protein